ncbi:MAG: hypothetical protein JXB30_04165 [Anaerolineae bacterium]|nr:hypothetical protein [Anaerolineae bacterium]
MKHRCNQHCFSGITLAVLPLILSGCLALPGGTSSPAPTVTPVGDAPTPTEPVLPTATPSPAPTVPLVCDANAILRQVDELLEGRAFEAHYLTMNQQLTLSIWLVDPELDPQATQGNLADNNRRAMQTGLLVFQEVIRQVPCAREVFVNANPMIVDRLYQGWYRDVIPIRAFPETADMTSDELLDAMMGSARGFYRSVPPRIEPQPAAVDACTWPEARAAIAQHFGPERRNAAAYLIIDAPADRASRGEGVLVEVQWDVHTIEEMEEAVILENLNPVAEALSCLWPPVDEVEVFIVDVHGWFAVFGMVPGALIRERELPLPPERVLIRNMYEDEW